MGSSAKKKIDKKKDFKKPKLRVGKVKPKASNFTDTSFKSKSIVLKEQSISATSPTSSSQFSHHLSLLSSRSGSLRRDALGYLSTVLAARPVHSRSHHYSRVLLSKILPLILDGSEAVRSRALTTLETLRTEEIEGRAEEILLFVRAGMTHIGAGVRSSAMDILTWALELAGDNLVSSPGGWVKTLKYFALMLGWSMEDPHDLSSSRALFGPGVNDSKYMLKVLTNLNTYLATGLIDRGCFETFESTSLRFPLIRSTQHSRPSRSNVYIYLNVFRLPKDHDDEMYTTCIDRKAVFSRRLQVTIARGLATMKRQGGDIGRASAKAESTIAEGMAGYYSTLL